MIDIENEAFLSKVRRTNKVLNNNYENTLKCLNKECILKCLLNNISKNKSKPYNNKDIPGPFPYDYPYLENNKIICKRYTKLFVSIISLCNEFEERIAMRNVYENINSSIHLHFFIGLTSEECEKEYILERKKFKDISQIPIQETYVNQTLFTLYLHKILPKICPYANYYGKMDVDQYINFNKLMNLLFSRNNNRNVIYVCENWKFRRVNTDQNYKYSSPKVIKSYYTRVFPKKGIIGFTGSFTLYPRYISPLLYKESLNESHIIRMEDQHMAWLIYRLNKKKLNISYFSLKCIDLYKEKKVCSIPYKTQYGIHRLKGKFLFSFHKLLNNE